MYVAKTFTFEASHQIEGHFGKCARLHGHSWKLKVTCQGKIVTSTGVVIDFYNIKAAVQPIIDDLDHHHLGEGKVNVLDEVGQILPCVVISDIPWIPIGFKPTSENLLVLIASRLPLDLPWCKLELNETCTSSAVLERWEFRRYHDGKGEPHGETKGREEGNEEGKEVPKKRQEGDVTYIIDDDIPF